MNTIIYMKPSDMPMNTTIQIFIMNTSTWKANQLIMGIILICMTTVKWNILTSIHLIHYTCTNTKINCLFVKSHFFQI